jgi:hypothetical protein
MCTLNQGIVPGRDESPRDIVSVFSRKGVSCLLVGTHVHNPSVKSDRTCGRGRHMALLNVRKTSGALWMWRWQNGAITN